MLCYYCIRNLSFYLVSFLTLYKLGHLKLHTVGDVSLSHSLGLGVQGTSLTSTTTQMDGTTEGCVASLKDACGREE
jgi:hypothetical protein